MLCLVSLLLYLWANPTANFAGFLAGAVAGPVSFAAAWAASSSGAAWTTPRMAAAAAAGCGWCMGAAHCFFWAIEMTR